MAFQPFATITFKILVFKTVFFPLSYQVLEMIAPPYSPEFIQLFLPIVQNKDITGKLRKNEGSDDVSAFIGKLLRMGQTRRGAQASKRAGST